MEEIKPQASSKSADAHRLIRYHMIGAAASGLIPLPLVDLGLVTGLQVNLVRSLANLYELPFSEEVGKSLISALIGASIPGAAWSLLKLSPIGMIGAGVAGAASTYALGKVFVQHFESGGTFLTFDPDKVREHYARELRKGVPEAIRIADADEEDYGGIKP